MNNSINHDISNKFLNDSSISSDSLNFDGIDEDLAAFQEDEMVAQALQRGVDLKKYSLDLIKEFLLYKFILI